MEGSTSYDVQFTKKSFSWSIKSWSGGESPTCQSMVLEQMWLFETQHLLVVPLHEPRQQRCRVTTTTRCVLWVSVAVLCVLYVWNKVCAPRQFSIAHCVLSTTILQGTSKVGLHSTTIPTSSTRVSCGTRCVLCMSFVEFSVVLYFTYFTFVWFVFLILGFRGEQGINWLCGPC